VRFGTRDCICEMYFCDFCEIVIVKLYDCEMCSCDCEIMILSCMLVEKEKKKQEKKQKKEENGRRRENTDGRYSFSTKSKGHRY
jgi:hypothetical protein